MSVEQDNQDFLCFVTNKNLVLKQLMSAIDDLPNGFTPQKVKEVKLMFKNLASVERQNNERLHFEVNKFTELLFYISSQNSEAEGLTSSDEELLSKKDEIKGFLGTLLKHTT